MFVDSGGWIAFFSARDQNHAEADRIFRETRVRGIQMLTTNLVIAEVHRLILFRAGQRAASVVLDRIEASPRVRMIFPDAANHQSARSWLAKLAPHPVTYADAVSFAAMESSGCAEFIGFDNDFLAAGFKKLA